MLRSQPCTQLCPKLLPASRSTPYPPATAVSLHQWMLLFTDWSKMSRSNSLWQRREKDEGKGVNRKWEMANCFSWMPRSKSVGQGMWSLNYLRRLCSMTGFTNVELFHIKKSRRLCNQHCVSEHFSFFFGFNLTKQALGKAEFKCKQSSRNKTCVGSFSECFPRPNLLPVISFNTIFLQILSPLL